ncbi:MAG: FadR/GntR family transcriptional regulator [Peptococcaceae bacterium]
MLIKRNKLYEEVVEKIIEMIKIKEITEGEKLPTEKELAAMFGVSRMAIREALSALQSSGVVEVKHGSGTYLKDVNDEVLIKPITRDLISQKDNLLELLELRRGLDTEAVSLAAYRALNEHIVRLEDEFESTKKAVYEGKMAVDEDFNFHFTIAQATQNQTFIKVYNTIANSYYEGFRSIHEILQQRLGPRIVIINEHEEILKYIKEREPELARVAMRKHLDCAYSRLMQNL